ncbi:hypothetical protein CCACVL1_25302 [Corchorus capsularis]|uniref:Uncharacterized protein n=1 Tax=Corchorus capsularis TaxID=210143 RepID=A0A1R3GLB2_COCAP|nr:hypothetical protein CCACVL1_25302 [Corchorus capsularis]
MELRTFQVVELLSEECFDVVDVNTKNAEDLTALEFISKCDTNDESSDENKLQVEVKSRSAIIRMLQRRDSKVGHPIYKANHPFLVEGH